MLPFEPYAGNVWRMIEGQWNPATMKIVDTAAEQAALEDIIERHKPKVPDDCQHLDYQFRSPFRYGRYPFASRFRRAGRTPGVYYAAEHELTAALESAWGSVTFYRESPDTPLPRNPTNHTLIMADILAPVAIDLTHPEVAALEDWTHPTNYEATCAFAEDVRTKGCEAISYRSVRDPLNRKNLAVLTCAAFAQAQPIGSQTWRMFLRADRVLLHNESLGQSHEFQIGDQAFVH